MNKMITPRLIPALIAVAFSGAASASGFQLLEQNASGLGNAYAGSAAVAENASTIFYNPAGMTELKGISVSAGVNAIRPSFQFTNNASTNPVAMGGGAATGGAGGDAAGSWAPLPNGYMAYQINDKWHIGVGFGAPFGLATEYDENWAGRYHSIKFDIKTYNLNPSVAYKVNEFISIGVGVNWQRIEAEYIKRAVLGAGVSALVTNKLEGDAWGWNVGATIQPRPDTRIGISYRSTIKHKASGDQNFSNGLSSSARAEVELPDTFILSAVHNLNDRWDLLADASWTGWSSIPKLTIVSGIASDSLNLQFRDTWRFAAGANYKVNDAWKLKMGIAYDQSPVYEAQHRPASLPDNNRTWFSLGLQYAPSKTSTIDVGYSYLMVESTDVSNDESLATRGLLSGTYDSHAHIVGMQYSASF